MATSTVIPDAGAGLLDFAASPEVTNTTETTTVNNPTETTHRTETIDANPNDIEHAQGSETKTTGTKPAGTQGTTGTQDDPSSQAVRQLLKSIKDADPANAAAVKALHNSYERAREYQTVFPTVKEARDAQSFFAELAGTPGTKVTLTQAREAAAGLLAFKNNVEDSDQLLYSGDPKVIENIVADLKEQNHLDALGKLASPLLEALAQNDGAGYTKVASSLISSELRNSGFVQVFNDAFRAVNNGDTQGAVDALSTIARWFSQVEKVADTAKRPNADPERQAFLKEKEDFEANKVSEFRKGVATEADKSDNRALGSSLKGYLKTPFFQGFPKETLVDLAGSIKAELRSRLTGDKTYQMQMKAHWNSKTPDKAKILEYHNAKVESIAEEVVRTVVNRRYPTYSKGATAAAGRTAAAQQKTNADNKETQLSVATGKPVYVATKPKWEAIDFSKDPGQLLYIAGKAYLKGGKFVTWRR